MSALDSPPMSTPASHLSTPTPPTQIKTPYDSIGPAYTTVCALPANRVVTANVRHLATPLLLPNTKVLDLACGTGHITRALATWGAASVLGVDVSPAMIAAAREADCNDKSISYLVADASAAGLDFTHGHPFPLITAMWLLNYARDRAQLSRFFQTIYQNLAPGGTFIGAVPNVETAKFARAGRWDGWRKYGYTLPKLVKLEEEGAAGYKMLMVAHVGGVEDSGDGGRGSGSIEKWEFSFECFLWGKECFEEVALKTGFREVEWVKPRTPQELSGREEEMEGEEEEGYWDIFRETPNCSILVVRK